jgi:homoserine O-succinyltransferase/O-acetyltransferase
MGLTNKPLPALGLYSLDFQFLNIMLESTPALKVAILDMYAGAPNQGMRCILDILEEYPFPLTWQIFDVRGGNQIPDTSHDIYISTGGPGSPLDGDGTWDRNYFSLIDELWELNRAGIGPKKYAFFICHSFQMVCGHFRLGKLTRRKSTSFGVLPVHKTPKGLVDPLLQGLTDPFHVVDSRDWQVVQPNLKVFEQHGAAILSLEKIRDHVKYERAIMAVRFSEEFVGTQFHPEADPEGMSVYLQDPLKKQQIYDAYGEQKYIDMVMHLQDPEKIKLTHQQILPAFLDSAIQALQGVEAV